MTMFAVSLKETSDVDLVKPIKSFISIFRSVSGAENVALAELQTLRNKMVLTIKNKNYTETALVDMQTYFDQLGNLEARVPFNKLKIYFKWLDSFDNRSWLGGSIPYTMTTNLLYEKACVLFNIAALATQISQKQADDEAKTEESLKTSVRMFQLAAGLFSAVSAPVPESSTEQKPTPDLSSECAQALSGLCLAQAQEVVLRKAISDNKKDAVIAKISHQTGLMYEETLRLLEIPSVKALVPKDWLTVCAGKSKLFSGLSHWFMSKSCKENKSIGEEISRLQLAETNLQSAKSTLPSPYQGDVSQWISTVQDALTSAKKDNDFIYFEKVPPAEDLGIIEGATVVKAIPLADKFLENNNDLFASMPVFDSTAKRSDCVVS